MADVDTLINPNKTLWEKGDFSRVAETMRQSGEDLTAGLDIRPGMKVLDLGCGDGTTALPIARRGANVLGIDIASNLVAAGTARAKKAGLDNVLFVEGDASNLAGVAESSFDLLVTVFGAMFAPRPYDVASEMVRVTRRGGRIVMANWIPGDPTLVAQILKVSAGYTPPPPEGFVSPMTWGDEAEVRRRFEAAGIAPDRIGFERATWFFRYDGAPVELLDTFRRFYGPAMNAFEAAARNGREKQLADELEVLFTAQNRGAETTIIPATYLKVTVSKD